MPKSFLIFRQKEDSLEIFHHLKKNNFSVLFEPLAKVNIKNLKEIQTQIDESFFLSENSAIIITSIKAADFIIKVDEEISVNKEIRIFCLSKKTGDILIKNGFKNIVISDEKSAKNLAKTLLNFIDNNQEIATKLNFIYFSADQIRFDFSLELAKKINIKRVICYQVDLVENFSEEFITICLEMKLRLEKFDYVLIYSTRMAEIFIELAKKNNLINFFLDSEIACLSLQIAEIFKNSQKNSSFKKISTFSDNKFLRDFNLDQN